jgi:hypothetical protein
VSLKRLLVLVGVFFQPITANAQLETHQGVSVLAEYDTNARRLAFEKEESGDTPSIVVGDGLMRTVADFRATGKMGSFVLDFDAAMGTKMFYALGAERMGVGQFQSRFDFPLFMGFRGRVHQFTKMRGQSSFIRSYAVEKTTGMIYRNLLGMMLRSGVQSNTFYSVDSGLFSSHGPDHFSGASLFFTAKESLDLESGIGFRAFPFLLAGNEAVLPRLDAPFRFSVAATSQRNLFFSSGYLFIRNFSNARGESYFRHRFFGSFGFRLPADILCTIRGTFQFTQYDDGVSIGQQLFLADDDESQNSAQLYLSRPWIGGLHTEARLAWYGNEWARNGLEFTRVTAALGLRYYL